VSCRSIAILFEHRYNGIFYAICKILNYRHFVDRPVPKARSQSRGVGFRDNIPYRAPIRLSTAIFQMLPSFSQENSHATRAAW
jgi:hypothetical protein